MALGDSSRAIGAVTRLLQDHLIRRGFDVTVGKPEDAAKNNAAAKVNLFLYEAAFDAQLRNHALREGESPPLWLVLKFLLTAFDAGENSDTAAAHDLLGRGMAALQELQFLRLDALVAPDVQLALESNPEPLKVTFDEATADLLGKIMQGTDERYRLSAAFQVRPVLIAPAILPRGNLLVGVNYTEAPAKLIGGDGVKVVVIPSMGPRLAQVMPARFEVGAQLTVTGSDLGDPAVEVVLGSVALAVVERSPNRLVLTAEGSGGTPIAGGGTLSAGELPLAVRRRLSPTRVRSGNLLSAKLVPSLAGVALAGTDLQLSGSLLGKDSDDVVILLLRAVDGVTIRMFDTVIAVADQTALTVSGAATGTPAGTYRVVLRVNDQQANASPALVVP